MQVYIKLWFDIYGIYDELASRQIATYEYKPCHLHHVQHNSPIESNKRHSTEYFGPFYEFEEEGII